MKLYMSEYSHHNSHCNSSSTPNHFFTFFCKMQLKLTWKNIYTWARSQPNRFYFHVQEMRNLSSGKWTDAHTSILLLFMSTMSGVKNTQRLSVSVQHTTFQLKTLNTAVIPARKHNKDIAPSEAYSRRWFHISLLQIWSNDQINRQNIRNKKTRKILTVFLITCGSISSNS